MENSSVLSRPLPRDFYIGVVSGIIFSLITCGIYNLYWNYKQFQAMNLLLGRDEYNFALWLILSIITCGIYHVYYEWKMGTDLERYLNSNGHPTSNLALVGLVLACLGLTIASDAIYQGELNRLVEN